MWKNKMADIQADKNIIPAHLLERLGYGEPPYNPFEIAKHYGIEIDRSPRLHGRQDLSGFIERNGKEVKIWINSLEPENRQRFTMAHELGHYFNDISKRKNRLIEDDLDTLYREGRKQPMEERAHQFAFELLMPKDDIFAKAEKLLDETKEGSLPTGILIEKMSDIFKVSKLAMLYRLQNLKILKS